jgi:hypothetical protein
LQFALVVEGEHLHAHQSPRSFGGFKVVSRDIDLSLCIENALVRLHDVEDDP